MSLESDNEIASEIEKRKQREMEQRYRNVFGTSEGLKVLGDILLTCHFGVPIMTEAARHEYNIGVTIARMSGIFSAIEHQLGIEEE